MIPRAGRARPAAPGAAFAPFFLLALVALAGCASTSAPRRARSAHDVPAPAPAEASAEEASEDEAAAAPRTPPREGKGRATPPATGPVYQRGVATYYTDSLSGHPTATGEPYNPNELTAAHRTLPFGAVVDVARPDGRHVAVRINDRGPYGKGRIIDLSRRAAHEIGLLNDGVAKVLLRIISIPDKRGSMPDKRRRRR